MTRDVAPEALRDLLDRPSRATVAFVRAGAPDVLPARVRMSGQHHLFGVDADAAPALEQQEVVLVVDDRPYWFQLRGVSVRGIAVPVDPPLGDELEALVWYAIEARRVLAWDYGAIREEWGVLPPSDAVVRAFVAGSMVAHLATVSRAGRPFLTPLWFVADGGTLYLTTGLATRAATNIAHTPDVALLLVGEHVARAGDTLRLRGTATRQGGLPPMRVLLRIAVKYYVAPGGLASELANVSSWRLRALYYAQVRGGAGHLRIVPTGAELLRRP